MNSRNQQAPTPRPCIPMYVNSLNNSRPARPSPSLVKTSTFACTRSVVAKNMPAALLAVYSSCRWRQKGDRLGRSTSHIERTRFYSFPFNPLQNGPARKGADKDAVRSSHHLTRSIRVKPHPTTAANFRQLESQASAFSNSLILVLRCTYSRCPAYNRSPRLIPQGCCVYFVPNATPSPPPPPRGCF